MNLGSPELEMHLRLRVRREPIQLARRRRPSFLHYLGANFSLVMWSFVCLTSVSRLDIEGKSDRVWQSLAWYAFVSILFRSALWQELLKSGRSLRAFEILPISSQEVFCWHQQQEWRSSSVAAFAFLFLFSAIAYILDAGWFGLGLAVIFALIQWTFHRGLSAILIAARLKTDALLLATIICGICLPMSIVTDSDPNDQIAAVFGKVAGFGEYLPTMWPIRAFLSVLPRFEALNLWYFVPTVLVAAALPGVANRLRENYRLPFATIESAKPKSESRLRRWIVGHRQLPAKIVLTAEAAQCVEIGVRQLLQVELSREDGDWRLRSFAGRLAAAGMSKADREIMDFIFPAAFTTSMRDATRRLAILFAIVAILAWFFQSGTLPIFAAVLIAFVMVAIRFGEASGARILSPSGQGAPVHAYYPAMTFSSFTSATMKAMLVQWIVWCPIFFLFWLFTTWTAGQWGATIQLIGGFQNLASASLVILYLGIAFAPRYIARTFRPLRNNTYNVLSPIAVMVLVQSAMFSIGRPFELVGVLAAIFVLSFGEWQWYQNAYSNHRVDLVILASSHVDARPQCPL